MEPGSGQTVQGVSTSPSVAASPVPMSPPVGEPVLTAPSTGVVVSGMPVAGTQPAATPASLPAASIEVPKRSVRGVVIDLLPEMSVTQVQKIEKKGRSNVFAVMLIFTVAALTVGVLFLNLLTKADLNRKTQQLADEKRNIVSLQYIELKQGTLVTKVSAYEAVRDFDFSPDIVLQYLLDVAGGLSEVTQIQLNENLEFSINGSADSYINVARLWHDMASQEDYFASVSLDSIAKTESEEGAGIVGFAFSGVMVKENLNKL
jgi:hypothetical protein